MKQKFQISVLMTVFNNEKFILQSINSIINQKFQNYKLIIINDGSYDQTIHILRKIKNKNIQIFNLKKNIGRTKALNFGLTKCKSKYIAILDSDDLSHASRLKIQFDYLENNPDVDLVYSYVKWINEDGNFISKSNNFKKNISNIIFENIICHSTIMFRSIILKKIGNYPNSFIYAQDYAFCLKVYKYFKISLIKKNLCFIRSHKNNMTNDLKLRLRIIKEQLFLYEWITKNLNISHFSKFRVLIKKIKEYVKFLIAILFKTQE